jgi:hypothetical protein
MKDSPPDPDWRIVLTSEELNRGTEFEVEGYGKKEK